MMKKLILAAAGLALSAPVLADHGYRGNGNAYRHSHRVVVHEYYRPAPRPVVVYRAVHPNTGAAILVGAVLGAAIAHHVITGY